LVQKISFSQRFHVWTLLQSGPFYVGAKFAFRLQSEKPFFNFGKRTKCENFAKCLRPQVQPFVAESFGGIFYLSKSAFELSLKKWWAEEEEKHKGSLTKIICFFNFNFFVLTEPSTPPPHY
jgi:hypothetical protein